MVLDLEAAGPITVLVDLPGCVIPWEVETFEVPKSDKITCDISRPRITYVQGNKIFLNTSFKDAECCYKGLIRRPDSGSTISKTEECVKIGEETYVTKYDAVVVICNVRGDVYDDYHAIVRRKTPVPSNTDVPNVVIIGLDSVSRFHFHTLMPKTKQALDELGSIEMLGYMKVHNDWYQASPITMPSVGDNTFPNSVAFLTGYKLNQVIPFCFNISKIFDICPLIWNNISMATAILEDAPSLSIFNFFNPPATHYLRPLMLATLNDNYPHKMMFPCVGSRTTETFVLEHIQQLMEYEAPLFSYTWLTSLAHENVDNLPGADLVFSKFILSLNLSNTILVFMSDHGHRYGNSRTTFNGWFNDKLPFFTITMPSRVKNFLGDQRIQILKSNSRKLTTPFDAYHTLRDILEAYNVKEFDNPPVMINGKLFPRTQGQSLFSNISPDRTCAQAGIPKDFCACADLRGMDLKDPIIQKTVRYAISRINKWIPRRCRVIDVSQITAAAKLNENEFVVGFTTKPGGFQLETMGSFDGSMKDYRISRVNKMTAVWCLNDWFLEFYCYCDFFGFLEELVLGKYR
ncbi:unnamed protein product [Allacma fusca]|uniref:DUF229 domain containing protein n=1 Tax=Allacma fusca TaxID=39272 RepID=A0A8J2PGS3_9HEXA|nr:unnamed protein product [Allacma fusca]